MNNIFLIWYPHIHMILIRQYKHISQLPLTTDRKTNGHTDKKWIKQAGGYISQLLLLQSYVVFPVLTHVGLQ